MFEVGELVRARIPVDGHTWWREPKTGVVVGPPESSRHTQRRYVSVLVDGTIVKVDEMKMQRVEQS